MPGSLGACLRALARWVSGSLGCALAFGSGTRSHPLWVSSVLGPKLSDIACLRLELGATSISRCTGLDCGSCRQKCNSMSIACLAQRTRQELSRTPHASALWPSRFCIVVVDRSKWLGGSPLCHPPRCTRVGTRGLGIIALHGARTRLGGKTVLRRQAAIPQRLQTVRTAASCTHPFAAPLAPYGERHEPHTHVGSPSSQVAHILDAIIQLDRSLDVSAQ